MNEVPIDPDVVELLSELAPPEQVAAADLTPEQHRQAGREAMAYFTEGVTPLSVHGVTDEVVPGRDGKIPVRVYNAETPAALIVFMHGGAWMTGSLDMSDVAMRRLCHDTRSVVVSVDYRMIPENPFPAPIDDTYDAIVWAVERFPNLPVLVAGDSAGGTLATCAALRSRDEGGPRIDGQVLIYPGIDDDYDAPSMVELSDDVPNSREDLRFFIDQYAGTEAAAGSPYALPARAESLAGLPPAVIAIAGHDRLRSSEEAYAERLQAAGVPVTVQLDLELVHAWFDFAPRVPAADRAFARLTTSIHELIHRGIASA
ncbi:alpha/beta hydrolase [Aeromicrobium terrae]|uniref:Alpha/beta hydrolase n=1 Tax=Aeromicrobium terrae TaxID=2498846 RepID=A0A5C8NIN5_9ACTN|nr:alpha/beta hydrolase [Aeromicrobium terrae]TXL60735.1 alpha/beta hydrolase [Aeromicrobium terrae]